MTTEPVVTLAIIDHRALGALTLDEYRQQHLTQLCRDGNIRRAKQLAAMSNMEYFNAIGPEGEMTNV